jgi:RNA polymerase sigma-70 factor (ECF subfamily)
MDAKHQQLLTAFVTAARSGDLDGLKQLLASDVRVTTDGGGKAQAALNVLEGSDRVSRFFAEVTRKGWREDYTLQFATVNSLPGIIVRGAGGPVQTAAFDIEDGVIRAMYIVRNPEKLRHLAER